MNYTRDLTAPYKKIDFDGIVYSTCVDYQHISRYRNLRQVIHCPSDIDNQCVTLETPNPFITNSEIIYHEVTMPEENRLDIIAKEELGSATYSWVIAYYNKIEDGYTVREGQRLIIPKAGITQLLNQGEILAPITALKLNLGEE